MITLMDKIIKEMTEKQAEALIEQVTKAVDIIYIWHWIGLILFILSLVAVIFKFIFYLVIIFICFI